MGPISIVGREAELHGIRSFLDGLPSGAATLRILGAAGMGKTVVWQAGVQEAHASAFTVLVARPSSSETSLSFAGLGDLLGPVLDDLASQLPAPQRDALRRRGDRHALPRVAGVLPHKVTSRTL